VRRGYVRHSGRVSEKKQIAAMVQHLVEVYYVEGDDENVDDAIRSLREGDEFCLTTLDRAARKRSELPGLIDRIHDKGAVVVELWTGRRSDRPADAARMVAEAFEMLLRDHKSQTRKAGRKAGRKGGRPPKDKMQREQAEVIWFDVRVIKMQDAIERMTGWNYRSAYREFGPRGVHAGRPRKPKA
jgi:DNA invertase Pin-like site-specific DNA recombinase